MYLKIKSLFLTRIHLSRYVNLHSSYGDEISFYISTHVKKSSLQTAGAIKKLVWFSIGEFVTTQFLRSEFYRHSQQQLGQLFNVALKKVMQKRNYGEQQKNKI
ncbi:CLUMA_CG007652, isoform A [Clunio marinus]|uniref:CLUMA_CG007652, isoform A n=1 Tax=Clunio marinus TaxID=568069 RepID=A0A1J1I3G3_9DIPT|nr:CLUMA_CG007652, isoform A [Clunio marinus]